MQPTRRHILSSLVLSPLGASALNACQRSDNVVRLWAMGIEGEALGAFVAQYKKQNPQISIHVQALPWSAAHEKLLTAFADDKLPDIIALGNTWIPEFAALDALEPLDIDLSDTFEGAVQAVTIEGQILAAPWYVDTRLLFYRRDMLQQAGFNNAPITHIEWIDQLAALKKKQGQLQHGLFMPVDEYEPLVSFCLQAAEPILTDQASRGGFTQKGIVEAFDFVASLYERGYAKVMTAAQMPNLYAGFERGDFAFFISGPWNIGELDKRLSSAMRSKWATAPLPGKSAVGASLSGGVSLCITKKSRQKPAAFDLIKYLTAPQQQSAFAKVTGDLPSSKIGWELAGLNRDLRARAFYEQLLIAKVPPAAPEWERIGVAMAQALERVVRHQISRHDAVNGLNLLADKLLAKRRYMLRLKGAAHG